MWWGMPYQDGGQWTMGWWMPFHGILSMLMFILVIAALVALVRFIWGGGHGGHRHGRSPGLDVLEERYARGEIQREEYLQKKRDLGG